MAHRIPKPATPGRLLKAALAYLERFAASRDTLRRVLMRRVAASARVHGTDPEAGAAEVAAILDRLAAQGLLDDRTYAEGRVAALRRRGVSERLLRLKLRDKGVADDHIDAALGRWAEDAGDDDPEYLAALNLARRRRLGPFRDPAKRAAMRDRDMAALARAGFDPDTARRVIDLGETPDLDGSLE